MEYPLVSIVCVSMNHEKYVEQGLRSFLSQTYKNIELFYVDNASSDTTYEKALAVLASSEMKTAAFKRERSYNLPQNLNFLLEKAKGEYIFLISCDDWILPECIEEMVKYYEANKRFGLVYGNGWFYKQVSDKLIPAETKKFIEGNIFDSIFLNGVIFPVGVMIKRETFDTVGTYDEGNPIEDYEFWLRVAKVYEIGYQRKPLIVYRHHATSFATLGSFSNIKNYLEIVDKYKDHRLYKQAARNFRKYLIYESLLKNEKKKTLSMLLKDLRPEKFYFSILFKLLTGIKK